MCGVEGSTDKLAMDVVIRDMFGQVIVSKAIHVA
jgi:hypothetical protein